LFLLIIPSLAVYHFHFERRRAATMRFTRTVDLRAVSGGFAGQLVHLPRALRVAAVCLIVLALARPQRSSADLTEVEGIDIVLALDVSNSMAEQDLAPNRLQAA